MSSYALCGVPFVILPYSGSARVFVACRVASNTEVVMLS